MALLQIIKYTGQKKSHPKPWFKEQDSYICSPNANLLGAWAEIESLHHMFPVSTPHSSKKLQHVSEAESLFIKQYSKQVQKTWFYLCLVNLLIFLFMASRYLPASNYLNCNWNYTSHAQWISTFCTGSYSHVVNRRQKNSCNINCFPHIKSFLNSTTAQKKRDHHCTQNRTFFGLSF